MKALKRKLNQYILLYKFLREQVIIGSVNEERVVSRYQDMKETLSWAYGSSSNWRRWSLLEKVTMYVGTNSGGTEFYDPCTGLIEYHGL